MLALLVKSSSFGGSLTIFRLYPTFFAVGNSFKAPPLLWNETVLINIDITQFFCPLLNTGDQLLISYSPKDSAWVAENVIRPLLDVNSMNFELQKSINPTVVDSVLDRSRQRLIVLSKDWEDLASNFCQRKGRMSIRLGALGNSDSRVILVSIGKIPKSQSKSLSCLGKTTLLEFEKQKKQVWQKSLLNAVLHHKIARL